MQLLDYRAVLRKLCLPEDYSAVSRLMKGDTTFPRPVQLGLRRQRWLESDIDNWIKTKMEATHGSGSQAEGL